MEFRFSESQGGLSAHRYRIDESGIHESTPVNEGLHKWTGIEGIADLPGYIVIGINAWLLHMIAKRCFASPELDEAFAETVRDFWYRAHRHPHSGT